MAAMLSRTSETVSKMNVHSACCKTVGNRVFIFSANTGVGTVFHGKISDSIDNLSVLCKDQLNPPSIKPKKKCRSRYV